MRQADLRRREELKRKQAEAGLVGEHFPQVQGIVMKLTYFHRHAFSDTDRLLMLRTMNISPESHAYFHLPCPEKECTGEYNLSPVITGIVEKRSKKLTGELVCKEEGPYLPQNHSSIKYEIEVTYKRKRS
jgi:hypothetical protein